MCVVCVVCVLTISFAQTISHLPLVLLGAAHRLSDQRKVVQLHELAEDEVHLALVQFAAYVRRIAEVLAVQVALQVLHLLEVDADVRGHLRKARLRLVHLEHLERHRVVVRAHRPDPALEHDARLKGQVRGIPGRAVFAPPHLQQTLVVVVVVVAALVMMLLLASTAAIVLVLVLWALNVTVAVMVWAAAAAAP